LPGSFQGFLVIYFAVFAQDLFAELFIRPVTLHAARQIGGVRSVVNSLQVQR